MINKLHLCNFQSHENTILEFSPYCNVIVGPSNVGKSSIIRALLFVLYNGLKGNSFVRIGSKYAEVVVNFSEGKEICRKKGRDTNFYVLDGVEWKDFGDDNIPKSISLVVNIPEVLIDKDKFIKINLSSQLEGSYLFFTPDSFKAKTINRLSNSHVIDSVLRKLLGEIKGDGIRLKSLEGEISEIDFQLQRYHVLDDVDKATKYIEDKLFNLESKADTLTKLSVLNEKVCIWNKYYQEAKRFLYLVSQYNLEELRRKIDLYEKLNVLLTSYNQVFCQVDNIKKHLSLMKECDIEGLKEGISLYEKSVCTLESCRQVSSQIESLKNQILYVEKEVFVSKKSYEDELKKQRICPTCGQKIPEDYKYE